MDSPDPTPREQQLMAALQAGSFPVTDVTVSDDDTPQVGVTFAVGATPDQVRATSAYIAAFDWSDQAQQARLAALALATVKADPAYRAIMQQLTDQVNLIRAHVGMDPIAITTFF